MARKSSNLTPEEYKIKFLAKAKIIHGDKYSYDKIVYVNTETKVCLVCPKHGDFWIAPGQHLNGHKRGCQECGYEKLGKANSLTQERFLKKCKRVHENRYDYSKTIYHRIHTPVIVGCAIHGDFSITPATHIHDGYGCKRCGKEDHIEALKTPKKEFVRLARAFHGKRVYNYKEIEYNGMSNFVTVTCKKHGSFKIQAWQFSHKRGCPTCGKQRGHISSRLTTKEFVEKAKAIHGDRYDYFKTKYSTAFEEVTITCKKHGDFDIMAMAHTKKDGKGGCRQCAVEYLNGFTREGFVKSSEKNGRKGILYFVSALYKGQPLLKVGITNRTIDKRFIPSWNIKVVNTYFGEPGDVWDLERQIHEKCLPFANQISIDIQGGTECYPPEYLHRITEIWSSVVPTPKVVESTEKTSVEKTD